MALMSCGDGGLKEFNTETWYAAGAGVEAENEIDNKRNESTGTVASIAAGNDSIVRWEKFLSKMTLRVLLVESDDSTRQIIAALLRKCSYRVSAVSDGLMAWEVLKRRAQNFDLILTEVDLPSISGFALLTLIMEHTICKNIPVIMMSSQDSVNTVYKCMLRGAADFLVKPVRKNELKNLWQHVWRRQASSSSGIGQPDESVAQQTLEATAENNDTSNCSGDDMVVCIKRSREGVEKGNDDQSSCTKLESEVEGTHVLYLPYSKRSKTSSTNGIPTNIGHNNLTKEVEDYHVGDEGSLVTTGIDSNQNIEQYTKLDNDWRCFDATKQAWHGENHEVIPSTREAIDLIGAFDKHLTCINRNSNSYDGINKSDSLPFLDLSLKRSILCVGLTNQVTEERPSLNHSDASAFSRYVNKTECSEYQEAHCFNQIVNINSDPCESSDQPEKIENRFPLSRLSFQNKSDCESLIPPTTFYIRSVQSTDSVNVDDRNVQCEKKEKQRGHVSYAIDENKNKGFCNVIPHNLGLETNNGKRESAIHVGDSLRSIQREAALTKFRLKRKDRCFQKKVRYESRKKLAEKRPRVKGQFVCQLSNQLLPAKSSLV